MKDKALIRISREMVEEILQPYNEKVSDMKLVGVRYSKRHDSYIFHYAR